MNLDSVRKHIRDREYMDGVARSTLRVKQTGEVFTPTPLVQEMLDRLPIEVFRDPSKTFLDPACGDGQFLGEIVIRKMEAGADFYTALRTTYGVDLMSDNVALCRERLACGDPLAEQIVRANIVQHDGLAYDWSFNGTDKLQDDLTFDELFELDSNE